MAAPAVVPYAPMGCLLFTENVWNSRKVYIPKFILLILNKKQETKKISEKLNFKL